jgi:DNA-binding winged helix-turn-helix (wHTH) protein
VRASFGPFLFDSDTREVFRGEEHVSISPKAFELLDLLIRNRPRALSKSEIHDRLWPRTFVSDASLTNLIAELRAALKDPADTPRFLRTVRRFGYAFVGEARSPGEARPAGPVRRLIWEAREIPLDAAETLFGRDDGAHVRIDDASVSRRHARIVVRDGSAMLEDLGSKNGTFVNRDRLSAPVRLSDGDRIEVGRACLTFRESSPTRSTQTERSSRASRGSAARSRQRR